MSAQGHYNHNKQAIKIVIGVLIGLWLMSFL